MASFIKRCPLGNRMAKDIPQIGEFRFAAWEFLTVIYKSGWDKLTANDKEMLFRQCISSQFNKKPAKPTPTPKLTKSKQADISRISPLIPSRPNKSILARSKYFKKIQSSNFQSSSSNNCSYVQASKGNIKEIIKIKDTFLKLSSNKIIEIYDITNNKG